MSTADDVSTGASVGGWLGAYAGYLRGITSGGPGFSNSRFLERFVRQWGAQLPRRTAGGPGPSSTSSPSSASSPVQWQCSTDTECEFLDCMLDGGTAEQCLPGFDIPEDWEGSSYPGGPQKIPKPGRGDPQLRKRDKTSAFVAPVPWWERPDVLLSRVPKATGVLGRILALPPWAWLPGLILFPSETADDDVITMPQPRRIPPRKRPEVVAPPSPQWPGIEFPDRFPVRQPKYPDEMPRKVPKPVQVPEPVRLPFPTPQEYPQPKPQAKPQPKPKAPPKPAPAPRTAPPGPSPWSPFDLLPLLMPSARPTTPAQRPGRVSFPESTPTPLTQPNPWGLPFSSPPRTDTCECDTPRKRKKKRCANPVVSRRKSTRGGQRYVTTTRRIECQV